MWVLLFSCLYSRAIHLEILESMDTASFLLAFNRFQAIRGDCAYLRSDAGSNFIGARNEEFDPSEKVPDRVINDVRGAGRLSPFVFKQRFAEVRRHRMIALSDALPTSATIPWHFRHVIKFTSTHTGTEI